MARGKKHSPEPAVTPDSPEVISAIEAALKS